MKRFFAVAGLFSMLCLFGCNSTPTPVASVEVSDGAQAEGTTVGVSNEGSKTEVYGSVGMDVKVSK